MLKIDLEASINSIPYLLYMTEQEDEDNNDPTPSPSQNEQLSSDNHHCSETRLNPF